jgi:hypothetical protein
MEINLEELKSNLYGWFYEGFGRGIDSSLSEEEARILYDCMVVVNQTIKNGGIVNIDDVTNRP